MMTLHSAEQLIADLTWLLEEQENFVADYPLSDFLVANWRTRLERLSHDPESLILFMAQAKSHFLGTYFEQLFSFAVHHFTDVEVLAEHAQIHVSGKTYGEVDLLVKDSRGRVLQFEIALKFYLQREDLAPNVWIGPNKNDSLLKKLTHARDHQLQILNIAEGKIWLESLDCKGNVVPNLMIYGRHFYDLNLQENIIFEYLKCGAGWVRLTQLLKLEHCLSNLYEAKKPYWISPNLENIEEKQITKKLEKSLLLRFEHDPRPVLFSCKRKMDNMKVDLFWLFVCPDEW